MWFEGTRLDSVRHECKREDDIRNWIWNEFDGDGYGKQRLTDVHNYVRLNLRYLKEGDDWIAEITGNPLKKSKVQRNVTLIFYLGVAGEKSYIQVPTIHSKRGSKGPVVLPFYSGDYGDGHIRIVEDALNVSPVNLNHPFSALHFIASDPKDDRSLENYFWFGETIKNLDDAS
ncbi:uncharacterized protein [Blastocystis hominis]|uniref:Glycosyl hydrolase family 63 N-terminal domain-containing protein n=1 Tax=Blastocystis hominis TaxID=12968 RepID=D8LWS2_BLAHO|nr:uncharacterized protein [Blastocystis hominis]CBK20261.2 unnamed protein product [Blastocystis hominis]|eukprot:XP_012894309.1 uncharacterized protein [Blastocystis hominis]